MYHEISRKFLIIKMPSLRGFRPVLYERYFLQCSYLIEERIQKVGDVYEYEKKIAMSPHERTREKKLITEAQFNKYKTKASKVVFRESFLISKKNPRLSINRYLDEYKGLTFAEVEFDTKEEAENFDPLTWMGTEITDCLLGRDCWLVNVDREHFLNALDTESKKLDPDFELLL